MEKFCAMARDRARARGMAFVSSQLGSILLWLLCFSLTWVSIYIRPYRMCAIARFFLLVGVVDG